MITYDKFVEIAAKFTFLKYAPRDPDDLLEKFNSFKFIESEIGSDEDLLKGLISWSKNNDVFPSHIELKDSLESNRQFSNSSMLLEMDRENSGLIKGRSVEVNHSERITPKQAYFLNTLYWNACDEIPSRDLISSYPEPRGTSLSDKDDIKIWLGRAHGELIVKTSKDPKTHVKTTATEKAIENIKQIFYIDEDLAKKYLALNQDGFFEEEKQDDIKQHWMRRVSIDLTKYKDILKLMDVKESEEV